MKLTVKSNDIMETIELHSFQNYYYYSKKDGEVYFVSEDELKVADDDYDIEDFPEWQRDNIKLVEDILYSDKYIKLPDSYDINDYDIMEDFCFSLEDKNIKEIMIDSIKGKGAFERFKANIHKLGIADEWYAFQEEAYIQIAKNWCEYHGIEYIEESK